MSSKKNRGVAVTQMFMPNIFVYPLLCLKKTDTSHKECLPKWPSRYSHFANDTLWISVLCGLDKNLWFFFFCDLLGRKKKNVV